MYQLKIYILYTRALVEQNLAVWHLSITQEDVEDKEQVHKIALKVISNEEYQNYEHALLLTGLDKLCFQRKQ